MVEGGRVGRRRSRRRDSCAQWIYYIRRVGKDVGEGGLLFLLLAMFTSLNQLVCLSDWLDVRMIPCCTRLQYPSLETFADISFT